MRFAWVAGESVKTKDGKVVIEINWDSHFKRYVISKITHAEAAFAEELGEARQMLSHLAEEVRCINGNE